MTKDPTEPPASIPQEEHPRPPDDREDREIAELKQAIDTNNLGRVQALMTRNSGLHSAPLGYQNNGPLTWVAECRVPWQVPGPERLAIAQWMIDNGSDVHQGGDGPLMRAALMGYRIPMMELLVRNGANVNAQWNGNFPMIFAPCETLEPSALKWLLDHGADPNCANDLHSTKETALDYVIGTYLRSTQLVECIDILVGTGCPSRRAAPPAIHILRGRIDLLRKCLEENPAIVHVRFPELDFGSTGARRLTLRGATLLHVAAEYGDLQSAKLLVEHGADVNAAATLDEDHVGGQTPIYHAVSQGNDWGLPVAEFLVGAGAHLSLRVRLPGHYERPEEVVECTPLGYARLFPGVDNPTVSFLVESGAPD